MDPTDTGSLPDRSPLPTGPHPTVGPGTVRMPRWPGPLLAIVGALLAIGALGGGAATLDGRVSLDPTPLAWLSLAGIALFTAGVLYAAIRQLRIRRHLPPERYRGPSVLVLLALVFVVAGVLTAPFGSDAAALVLGSGEPTLLGSVVLLVSTQVGMLLVSWLLVFRPRALAGLPSFPGRNAVAAVRSGLGWGVVAWMGASVASVAVLALLGALGVEPEPQVAEQALAVIDPWLAVLAIVIVAPIAEELFFRGVVFNALRRERGRRWAYVGSASLFAVIHLSLAALVPILLLALMLAWVYDRTNNLLAPIAMHALVNGVSVLVALLARFEIVQLPV